MWGYDNPQMMKWVLKFELLYNNEVVATFVPDEDAYTFSERWDYSDLAPDTVPYSVDQSLLSMRAVNICNIRGPATPETDGGGAAPVCNPNDCETHVTGDCPPGGGDDCDPGTPW
jgi:hypothetical protein